MQTSDVRRAGTKGSVYLTIIGHARAVGEHGIHAWHRILDRITTAPSACVVALCTATAGAAVGPYQLHNTEAEHFQRGQLDLFEIHGAPDCGQLRQIEVRLA